MSAVNRTSASMVGEMATTPSRRPTRDRNLLLAAVGLVAGAWLIARKLCTAQAFVDEIARLRAPLESAAVSPQTEEQIDFVRAWARTKQDR